MTRKSTTLLAFAMGAATPAALVAQATTGIVAGRVTERATGQPLVAAQVQVLGTTRGAATGEDGRFRITGLAAGRYQLRVIRIGFAAQTVPVQVTAGATATVDFALATSTVSLDQVVVTATGAAVRERTQGSNIANVQVDSQALAAVPNFTSLLAARAAGVTVVQSGGTVGTGSRIRIRGANSINLSNEPLLIIDGVRINNDPNSITIGVGGQTISRFNDLKPEDIENVEVLKGPAATGLYGTAAANGVIQVTTRHGRTGRTQWNAYGELGSITNPYTFPGNYTAYGHNPTTGAVANRTLCTLPRVGAGQCVRDSVTAYTPLNIAGDSPFRTGGRNQLGGSVSGGNEFARYFLSSDVQDERGVFATNNLTRRNFRANVDATPTQTFNISVNAGYLSSRTQLPQNDNNVLGLVSTGLLGGPVVCSQATPCAGGADTTSRGYYPGVFGYTPSQLNVIQTYQNVERFTGGFNARYTPFAWLNFLGTGGLDVGDRDDQFLVPAGVLGNISLNYGLGERSRNRYQVGTYTLNGSAQASFTPFTNVTSQTTAGVQYQRDNTYGTQAFGVGLVAGTGSLAGTTQQFSVYEQNLFARLFGVLVQEQVGWRDRLFVTGAVRGDRNSAFGKNLGFVTYPSAQASYVISDEPFFPKSTLLSQLKLRAAYGQSGLRPNVFDALQYYAPVAATVNGQSLPAFTVYNPNGNPTGGFGLSNLRPERVNEAEGGFDLGLFNGRASLEATYFAKRSRDALIAVVLPPSAGGPPNQLRNIGQVTNKGLELSSNVNVYESKPVSFNAVLNFSTLENKLVSLAPGVTPIIYGLGGATERHTPGYPLGAYFQPKYTYSDANHDGIIEPNEVQVDAAPSYIGNPLPRRTFSAQPALTLFQNVRVQALFDYRGGFYLYNATEQFRCVTVVNCRALYDPTTPLDQQARAVAARYYGTYAGYMEKANFTKLRELSVTFGLPQAIAARIHTRGANVTLAGRNLYTWTKYTGLDPELNFAGQSNQTFADFLTQPPVRYYVARLNFDF